ETITEAEYLEMIALKTAVLLGFSLQVGALLGGATHETAQKLYDFGVNIGIGFQLKDDLLDVFGETEKVGKQKGGDIVANKKTFLLIKAIELAQDNLLYSLNYWMSKKNFSAEEKVNAITEIYKQLSIQEITLQKMNEFFARAFQLLNRIELPEERKELLRQFTQQLIEREK
ncbi:MAG: polyprenyl synthetase family protein, partial [Flammeovirgaceae bacterium]|nr:polyprenyl synthetase family protein [Flammeovirgaceae bacterium]MDW8286512.1 polyprenyl synthetase family protein [Flammeovirgaceae bacterium]